MLVDLSSLDAAHFALGGLVPEIEVSGVEHPSRTEQLEVVTSPENRPDGGGRVCGKAGISESASLPQLRIQSSRSGCCPSLV